MNSVLTVCVWMWHTAWMRNFVRRLREVRCIQDRISSCLGEMLHGDYNRLMNDQMLHSATNYECYKGLYSSFNSMNMFEIVHSLLRQFGPENWTLYKGKHLLSFVDNHDVTRVASILNNENHLPLIYAMAFGMPGSPVSIMEVNGDSKPERKMVTLHCVPALTSRSGTACVTGSADWQRPRSIPRH